MFCLQRNCGRCSGRVAGLDRISVDWDTATFLNLLQFMFTGYYGISSATVVNFLEVKLSRAIFMLFGMLVFC